MYPRSSGTKPPVGLIVIGGVLFIFGAYFLWNGFISFMGASGNISAPITAAANTLAAQTQLSNDVVPTYAPPASSTPLKPCQDFRVNVVKARVRECPKDSCAALDTLYSQGALMCVYGPAPNVTGWYQVNLRPTGSFPQIAYISANVIYPLNPTRLPTRTFTPLPTVTPAPTQKPTAAPKLSATAKVSAAANKQPTPESTAAP